MKPETWENFGAAFTPNPNTFYFQFCVSQQKFRPWAAEKSREEHKEEVLKQLF